MTLIYKKINLFIFTVIISFSMLTSSFAMDKNVLVKIEGSGVESTVTGEEFFSSVNKLHSSSMVGKKLSSGSKSFEMQNYEKHLNKIIVDKLVYLESIVLDIESHDEFKKEMDLFLLNLSLNHLREKEIKKKVKISKRRIKKYFLEERKKQIAQAKKAKALHADDAKDSSSVIKEEIEDKVKEEKVKEEKADEDKSDKELIAEMTKADYDSIEGGFRSIEEAQKERKFFEKIRKRAKVKIDNKLLKDLRNDNLVNNLKKVIFTVNGEAYTVKDFILDRTKLAKNINDINVKQKEAEIFVNSRILDKRARKLGPKKDKKTKEIIEKKNNELQLHYFKKLVILPTAKVEDIEVKEFYENNKEKLYKNPELINLMVIITDEKKYSDLVIKKLKKRSDFGTLAGKYSSHESSRFGGDIGWVSKDKIPAKFLSKIIKGKGKKYVGPFEFDGSYYVYKVLDIKKSSLRPFEDVEESIKRNLFDKDYFKKYDEYVEKLKKKYTVEYNHEVLKDLGILIDEAK